MLPDKPMQRLIARLPRSIADRLAPVIESDFAQKVAETFATRIGLVGVGLVTSVIIARSLGPEGRGVQAVIATITAIGIQFGNFGLHSSNTYYVAKQPRLLGPLAGNSLLVSLGFGTVAVGAVAVVVTALPRLIPVHGVYLALALAGVPLGLCLMLLQNLLLGTHCIRDYNRIEFVGRILGVSLLGLVVVAGVVSVGTVTLAGLVSTAAIAAWTGVVLLRGRHLTMRPSMAMLKEHLGYGFKAYIAALFAYTVIKADVLMCSYLLGAELTGQYSIAASMADLVYMLPVVAGTIAFPRLSATEDVEERWRKAKTMTKWVALVMVVFAVVAGVLAKPAIGLLYGSAFLPAVGAFVWLLPGIVLLGVNTILMNYFASCGFPWIAVWSPAVASAANIAMNLVLLPRIGIVGASVSSTVAYGLMLVVSVVYIQATSHKVGGAHG